MDADTHRSEIARLTLDVKTRREEAERLKQSATGHRVAGNDSAADADASQAATLEQEANSAEQDLRSAESNLASTNAQIRDIESRQKDLQRRFDGEMSDLQKQKDRLQGGVGSFSSSIP